MIEGIMHGPYPGLTEEGARALIIEHVGVEPSHDDIERLNDDAQSQYQYEQGRIAVLDAMDANRIEQGIGHSVMSHILKPWSRNIRAAYYYL